MGAVKFDQQAIDALQTLGFKIADDKEMARIDGDDIDIYVFRRDDTELEFLLTIELPNGINLKTLRTGQRCLKPQQRRMMEWHHEPRWFTAAPLRDHKVTGTCATIS